MKDDIKQREQLANKCDELSTVLVIPQRTGKSRADLAYRLENIDKVHERYVPYMDEQSRERYYRLKAERETAIEKERQIKLQTLLPDLQPYTREYSYLSEYQFSRRDIHMDFIRRHNIQHFRLLSNQRLSSAVSARLLPPISKLSSRHEAILNCLRQEQLRKDNNSYLSKMLRDDVSKSGIHKYGLSNPTYGEYFERQFMRPEYIFSEIIQSASDPILKED